MVSAINGHGVQSLLLGFILFWGVLFSVMPETNLSGGFGSLPQFPHNDSIYAAAAIKTQRSADKIENAIRGVDVSKYNGEIDWKKVAADNVDFAFIRATCGYQPQGKYKLNIDPLFLQNANEAHKNGIKVGAYHVAWFLNRDIMLNEAKVFIEMLEQVNITYPVILDIEYNPGRLSRDELSKLAKEFCDIVSAKGYTMFIYSYSNFFRDYLDLSKLGDYKLWVANYGETPKDIPHSIWQHTSIGKVKGISGDVDINVAYPDFEAKEFKPVTVRKTISDSIRERLLKRYKLDVPESKLTGIHEAVNSAVQKEINRQWNVSLPTGGKISQKQIAYLCELNFTSKTKGNLTYLIQAKLFYLGYYKAQPTAVFDGNTRNAIRSLQIDRKLDVTGRLSDETLKELFG